MNCDSNIGEVLTDEQFEMLIKMFDNFYKFNPPKKVVSNRITARHSEDVSSAALLKKHF